MEASKLFPEKVRREARQKGDGGEGSIRGYKADDPEKQEGKILKKSVCKN